MGDSMIDAQIADGDWVIIEKRESARHGDIVVAQTEDGEATLNLWFPERGRIRLQPANDSMKPIYVDSAKVLGVLAGVVRKTCIPPADSTCFHLVRHAASGFVSVLSI